MRILLLSILVWGATFAASNDGQKAIRKGPARRTSSSSGGEMYRAYCAACHGWAARRWTGQFRAEVGTGGLTQLAKRNSGKFPELQVFGAINGTCRCRRMVEGHAVWGVVFAGWGQRRLRRTTSYAQPDPIHRVASAMKPGYPAAAPGSVAADPYRRCSMRRRRRVLIARRIGLVPQNQDASETEVRERIHGARRRRPGAGAEEEKGQTHFLPAKCV